MPRSFPTRVLLSSFLVAATLAACTDAPTSAPARHVDSASIALRSLSVSGCNTTLIAQLAGSLLPVPHKDPDLDLTRSAKSIVSLSTTQLALARSLTLRLGALLADPRILAVLRDPNGAAPPTKGEAISMLMNEIFTCVRLTPPGDISGAYSPGGGAKVITGAVDDTLRTNDGFAMVAVPAGAVTGSHLFTISPKTAQAITRQCLPDMPGQYNQCYAFNVSPSTTFAEPVTIAMCTLEESGTLYGTPTHEAHHRLRIASLDHHNPGRIRIYPRKEVPLACEGFTLAQAPSGDAGWLGGALRVASRVASTLVRPFQPRLAWAIDGVGTELLGFTDYTTVDNAFFTSGFEVGEVRAGALPGAPLEPVIWSLDGYWNQNTTTGVSNGAVPDLVSLASGDLSASLPAPFTGSVALWFGSSTAGNYGSPFANGQDGGTSTAPRAGLAYSPYFRIPLVSNQVSLTFRSWFEIESVNPSRFDLMTVVVEDSASGAVSIADTRNPAVDPGGSARVPLTSGGFDAPPVWSSIAVDLSAHAGRTVRLGFGFDTGDVLYNGFRGWVIDDVRVTALDALVGTTQTAVASSRLQSASASASVSSPAPAREWRP